MIKMPSKIKMKGFEKQEKYKKQQAKKRTRKLSKEEVINQAFKFHSQGSISEAAKYYKYFIDQGYQDHRVFSNYGVILKNLGKLKDAEWAHRKAIELKPNFAEGHSNLGNTLKDLGKTEEAELSLHKAIELKSDYTEAYLNLGLILKNLDKLKEAELSTRKAIELKPDYAEAHTNLGSILKNLGKLHEAEVSTRKAIKLKPHYAEAHTNLGSILKDLGKLHEAEVITRKAITINPLFAGAHLNLGSILKDLGKLHEAELSTREAITINPHFAGAHLNLGSILRDLGKLHEAELSQRKAIELNPHLAEAHTNLGSILEDLGKLHEAELSHRKAIELNPNLAEAYFNLSFIELLKGNYYSGLENYEFRFKKNKPTITHGKPKSKRIYNKKLNKGEKLLIVSEQGLGDTLQFMRYIPYLRSQGFNISFCAQEKLHTLIKASDIDPNPLTPAQVNKVSEGHWIPLLSLPRYLEVNPKNPIMSEPYIFSTGELIKKWKNILSQERKPIIGINWQGNPKIEKGYLKGRSLPLETFSTIAKRNNVTFLSLQKGFGSEQLDNCTFKKQFVECQTQINSTWDFLENTAIINNCDLIITNDTSVAHLAGGMGKSTWLLLKHLPEWRWGLEKESTFWYPSMRLFRQKEKLNWHEVIERISDELKVETKVRF